MSLERLQAESKGFPVNADGHIVDPRYVPAGSPYGRKLVEYAETTPQQLWPQWFKDATKLMAHKEAK